MRPFCLIAILFLFSIPCRAQLWSGILKPTSGGGACSFGQITSAGQCAIDWTAVGLPGGIPTTWTQTGSTITATSGDRTSTIQAALNACGTNHYVLLGAGTFQINSGVSVPNNCYLNGGGPQSTIVDWRGTSGVAIRMGVQNDAPYKSGTCTITGGNTAGSTSLTLSAATIGVPDYGCSVATGGYLVVSEANNAVMVTQSSPANATCTYCDVQWGGTRLREQTVEIQSVSGAGPFTVGISPALYTDYGVASGTSPAYATPFGAVTGGTPDCKYCGVENLQIKANGTGLSAGTPDMVMSNCAYCFVQNVEFNYTDADWLDMAFCYRCEVRNNYFSNAYGHGAGGSDADVSVYEESSASLVINNIMERGHASIVVDLGASGNVIAYNYSTGSYDAVGYGVNMLDFVNHGAYPQFNLWEGNIGPSFQPDSWHGNNGYNTVFRNWFRGNTTVATYPQQSMTGGVCAAGTCTVAWTSGPSHFYAGQYIIMMGTNQPGCGQGTLANVNQWVQPSALTGSAGSLSSTFPAGSCSTWTGGTAFTLDLAAVPTPIPHTGNGAVTWTSTYKTFQGQWSVTIPAFSAGNNLVGNVFGSTDQAATTLYNSGSGACTSCLRATTPRPYSGLAATTTFGYDTSGDATYGAVWATFPGGPSNTNGYWSTQGFTTTCYSSNFDAASSSTINSVNCSPSLTLPASFFLSAKPAWWTTPYGIPAWPAIGPEVTGGPDSGVGNHAQYNPAALCYNNTGKDSQGLITFDANACYASGPPPPPPVGPVTGPPPLMIVFNEPSTRKD